MWFVHVSVVHIRYKREVTGAFDCRRKLTLVVRAGHGHAARQNLTPLRHEFLQTAYIFIIYKFLSVHTKLANLTATSLVAQVTSAEFTSFSHNYYFSYIKCQNLKRIVVIRSAACRYTAGDRTFAERTSEVRC